MQSILRSSRVAALAFSLALVLTGCSTQSQRDTSGRVLKGAVIGATAAGAASASGDNYTNGMAGAVIGGVIGGAVGFFYDMAEKSDAAKEARADDSDEGQEPAP